MAYGFHRPDHRGDRTAPPAGRSVTTTAHRGRRWGRVLLVAGIATVCVVPATDALAAGRSAVRHPSHAVTAGKRATKTSRTRATTATTSATTTATTTAPDPVAGGAGTGEEPVVRSTEDLRWWPWGPVVSGRLNRPVKGGYSTLVLQRGEVTAVGNGTVTVTSADGVTITWTVTGSTRISGLPRTRHVRAATGTDPATTSTGTSTADPSAPATTSGLALHQKVGIWGTASGDVTDAAFVVVRGQVTPSPTSTTTDPTSTTTTDPTTDPTTATSTVE